MRNMYLFEYMTYCDFLVILEIQGHYLNITTNSMLIYK